MLPLEFVLLSFEVLDCVEQLVFQNEFLLPGFMERMMANIFLRELYLLSIEIVSTAIL